MRITIKAPFRRGRLAKAIMKTKPFVQRRWDETTFGLEGVAQSVRVETPDTELAAQLGLNIVKAVVERGIGGRRVLVTRYRLVIPHWMRRNSGAGKLGRSARSKLYNALKTNSQLAGPWVPECGGLTVYPDEVIEFLIAKPDGDHRAVHIHSVASRILRRMVLDTLQAVIDPRFSDCSHAYRPGRNRFTALAQARTYIRQGFHWACAGDIAKFFDSISGGLADLALRSAAPNICAQLRHLATSDCHSTILRRPDHLGRLEGKLKYATYNTDFLKQGDPLAPFLANVVADQFLDKPFTEVMGERARLIRYSDNVLVVAKAPLDAENGMAVLDVLLDVMGMEFNEEKTTRTARDIKAVPLHWLGKILRGGSVQTPEAKVKALVQQLTESSPASADFKSLAMQVCDELSLDKVKRVEFLRRSLGRRSQLHLGAFDLVRRAWSQRRGVEAANDGEPDDQAAEEVLEQQVKIKTQEFSNTTAA